MSVWLALAAALCFGAGDFIGGLGGRRSDPRLIPVVIQVVGVLLCALIVAVDPHHGPTSGVLGWGVVGGLGSGVGNAALYRGLDRGPAHRGRASHRRYRNQ